MTDYRYWLTRDLRQQQGDLFVDDGDLVVTTWLVFVMLNPSTATETEDDPTIRRCMGFARAAHSPQLGVVNLFGARSTGPRKLLEIPDPVGEDNDAELRRILSLPDSRIVAAWGTHKPELHRVLGPRVAEFCEMAERAGRQLRCLGTCQDGQPRHPLYVSADQAFEIWTPTVPRPR